LYPASNSFLFAEGLGKCYEQATYAKIFLADDGKAILGDLVNDDLQSLECEKQCSWQSGSCYQ
nr:GDYXXLXY protein [Gammaproteobacteria bacterium]